MFKITEFIADINKYGIVKSSNFKAFITKKVPEMGTEKRLSLRCQVTDVPSRHLMTMDNRIYGPMYRFGYEAAPSDINMLFLLSDHLQEKEYFDSWHDLIVGPYRVKSSGTDRYDIGYYDDYVGTVEIKIYDDRGEYVKTTKLIEAFPASVGPIQMSWLSGAEAVTLPVTFMYRYSTVSFDKERNNPTPTSPSSAYI